VEPQSSPAPAHRVVIGTPVSRATERNLPRYLVLRRRVITRDGVADVRALDGDERYRHVRNQRRWHMINRSFAAAAVAALLVTPAVAQTSNTTNPANTNNAPAATAPAPAATTGATGAVGFTDMQKQTQWLGSDLIGATVVNNANENIGEINDLLVDDNGMVQAAIIGVGGFLGIGEKDVAVSFKQLKVTRQSDGDLDKVMANFNKDQLKQAPEFKTVADQRSNQNRATTGSTTPKASTTTPPANRPANSTTNK
jgi:hypothetical protein